MRLEMHPQICLSLKSTKTRLLISNGESEKNHQIKKKSNEWHYIMSLDRALPRPSLCFTKAPIQTKLIPKLAQINPTQIKPSPKPYSNKQRLTANMRNENLEPILNQLISLLRRFTEMNWFAPPFIHFSNNSISIVLYQNKSSSPHMSNSYPILTVQHQLTMENDYLYSCIWNYTISILPIFGQV